MHEHFMQLALAEALRGMGRTHPNPVVGAVIVKKQQILGLGYHAQAGKPHAEIMAIQAAGGLKAVKGADLYVTLEPCAHVGRTGPCTEVLIKAGIKRVFVGMLDPNPRVNGRGVEHLRAAGIEVYVGLLKGECLQLNRAYSHRLVAGRPLVAAKIAASLDGRVATATGESQWITGESARAHGHTLRAEYDALLVGVGTVLQDDPQLTCRLNTESLLSLVPRDPIRIIVDTYARTPLQAESVRLSKMSAAPTWIAVGQECLAMPEVAKRAQLLTEAGVEILSIPTTCTVAGKLQIDLKALLTFLATVKELLAVLCEGGPTLIGGLFDEHLVDRLFFYVAPMIIGGEKALGAVLGAGASQLTASAKLTEVSLTPLGQDYLWKSEVVYT